MLAHAQTDCEVCLMALLAGIFQHERENFQDTLVCASSQEGSQETFGKVSPSTLMRNPTDFGPLAVILCRQARAVVLAPIFAAIVSRIALPAQISKAEVRYSELRVGHSRIFSSIRLPGSDFVIRKMDQLYRRFIA